MEQSFTGKASCAFHASFEVGLVKKRHPSGFVRAVFEQPLRMNKCCRSGLGGDQLSRNESCDRGESFGSENRGIRKGLAYARKSRHRDDHDRPGRDDGFLFHGRLQASPRRAVGLDQNPVRRTPSLEIVDFFPAEPWQVFRIAPGPGGLCGHREHRAFGEDVFHA